MLDVLFRVSFFAASFAFLIWFWYSVFTVVF